MKADGKMGQFGYAGKFLRVNLESRKIDITLRDESYYKHYLGGRGTIVHTLLTEVPPHVDPLGPENKLVLVARAPHRMGFPCGADQRVPGRVGLGMVDALSSKLTLP